MGVTFWCVVQGRKGEADAEGLQGTLKGFDQCTNLVVQDCHERIYKPEGGVEKVEIGLYVLRGDNIAVCGELDEEADGKVDLDKIHAEAMPHILH